VIETPALLALNISTLVVIIFGAHLLILRAFERHTYLPLAICLLAIAIIICQPTVDLLFPQWRITLFIFSLPAILIIAPAFWLYVLGLTSPTSWHFDRQYWPHLLPSAVGLLIALLALCLPGEIRNGLLVDGNDDIIDSAPFLLRYLIYGMLICTFVLVLGWVIQSGFYFYLVTQRLNQYRRHLKDLFASTETKEIRWLSWLLVAVGTVWTITAIRLLWQNLFQPVQFDPVLTASITLVMIWTLAIWGLRQKPGFEELYTSKDEINELLVQEHSLQTKYQRSALNEQQSEAIAIKIEQAIGDNKLYLDASLSLQKLAKHIYTSPNYISQTLNETLGMSFFDFVNKHRVEAAKHMLEHSDDTVLDIAMNVGFNAKSSFYSAFKKETQQTPSQYRKQSRFQSAK